MIAIWIQNLAILPMPTGHKHWTILFWKTWTYQSATTFDIERDRILKPAWPYDSPRKNSCVSMWVWLSSKRWHWITVANKSPQKIRWPKTHAVTRGTKSTSFCFTTQIEVTAGAMCLFTKIARSREQQNIIPIVITVVFWIFFWKVCDARSLQ